MDETNLDTYTMQEDANILCVDRTTDEDTKETKPLKKKTELKREPIPWNKQDIKLKKSSTQKREIKKDILEEVALKPVKRDDIEETHKSPETSKDVIEETNLDTYTMQEDSNILSVDKTTDEDTKPTEKKPEMKPEPVPWNKQDIKMKKSSTQKREIEKDTLEEVTLKPVTHEVIAKYHKGLETPKDVTEDTNIDEYTMQEDTNILSVYRTTDEDTKPTKPLKKKTELKPEPIPWNKQDIKLKKSSTQKRDIKKDTLEEVTLKPLAHGSIEKPYEPLEKISEGIAINVISTEGLDFVKEIVQPKEENILKSKEEKTFTEDSSLMVVKKTDEEQKRRMRPWTQVEDNSKLLTKQEGKESFEKISSISKIITSQIPEKIDTEHPNTKPKVLESLQQTEVVENIVPVVSKSEDFDTEQLSFEDDTNLLSIDKKIDEKKTEKRAPIKILDKKLDEPVPWNKQEIKLRKANISQKDKVKPEMEEVTLKPLYKEPKESTQKDSEPRADLQEQTTENIIEETINDKKGLTKIAPVIKDDLVSDEVPLLKQGTILLDETLPQVDETQNASMPWRRHKKTVQFADEPPEEISIEPVPILEDTEQPLKKTKKKKTTEETSERPLIPKVKGKERLTSPEPEKILLKPVSKSKKPTDVEVKEEIHLKKGSRKPVTESPEKEKVILKPVEKDIITKATQKKESSPFEKDKKPEVELKDDYTPASLTQLDLPKHDVEKEEIKYNEPKESEKEDQQETIESHMDKLKKDRPARITEKAEEEQTVIKRSPRKPKPKSPEREIVHLKPVRKDVTKNTEKDVKERYLKPERIEMVSPDSDSFKLEPFEKTTSEYPYDDNKKEEKRNESEITSPDLDEKCVYPESKNKSEKDTDEQKSDIKKRPRKQRPKSPEPEKVQLKPFTKKEHEKEKETPEECTLKRTPAKEKDAPDERPIKLKPVSKEITKGIENEEIDKSITPKHDLPETEGQPQQKVKVTKKPHLEDDNVDIKKAPRKPATTPDTEQIQLKPFSKKEPKTEPEKKTDQIKLKPVPKEKPVEPEQDTLKLKYTQKEKPKSPEREIINLKPTLKDRSKSPDITPVALKPSHKEKSELPEKDLMKLKASPIERPKSPEQETVKLKPAKKEKADSPSKELVQLKPVKKEMRKLPEQSELVQLKPVQKQETPEEECVSPDTLKEMPITETTTPVIKQLENIDIETQPVTTQVPWVRGTKKTKEKKERKPKHIEDTAPEVLKTEETSLESITVKSQKEIIIIKPEAITEKEVVDINIMPAAKELTEAHINIGKPLEPVKLSDTPKPADDITKTTKTSAKLSKKHKTTLEVKPSDTVKQKTDETGKNIADEKKDESPQDHFDLPVTAAPNDELSENKEPDTTSLPWIRGKKPKDKKEMKRKPIIEEKQPDAEKISDEPLPDKIQMESSCEIELIKLDKPKKVTEHIPAETSPEPMSDVKVKSEEIKPQATKLPWRRVKRIPRVPAHVLPEEYLEPDEQPELPVEPEKELEAKQVIDNSEEIKQKEEVVSKSLIVMKPSLSKPQTKKEPEEKIEEPETIESETSVAWKEVKVDTQSKKISKKSELPMPIIEPEGPLRDIEIISSKRQKDSVEEKLDEVNVVQTMVRRVRKKPSEKAVPPRFIQRLQPVISSPGRLATFQCKVEGVPFPDLKWYRNEKEITTGNRINISLFESTATLEITDAKLDDTGTYSCRAINTAGIATSNANLVLIGEC
ncbi:hypothetical protein B566_EDAN004269 [Ephemera danica]|nr:hypothetical protein B566_EDAN004269 [Ephemera danica]